MSKELSLLLGFTCNNIWRLAFTGCCRKKARAGWKLSNFLGKKARNQKNERIAIFVYLPIFIFLKKKKFQRVLEIWNS